MNVLTPRQGEFQSFQQAQVGTPSAESRSVVVSRTNGENLGTPLKQHNSSSINLGQVTDFSTSSPYRVMNSNAAEGMTSSPYKPPVSMENPVYVSPSATIGASGAYKQMESSAVPAPNVQSNVIYSSQPLTSADFGGMTLGSNGSYYQPMSMSGFSQVPMSNGFSQMPMSNGFSQMPMSNGFSQMPMSMPSGFSQMPVPSFAPSSYMSTAPMTPRLLMNSTPRGFTSSMNLPTTTQMGLTPRSYQDQMGMMNSDPMMMMFAESFRNQCLAMSQYYAAHPEEMVDSPKSAKVFNDVSPASMNSRAESAATLRRRMQQPSLRTIVDQENYDTSNVTPVGLEGKKTLSDDIMDILNQMTDQEGEEAVPAPASPAKEGTRQFPAQTQGPIVRAKPQSIWHKLGCGTLISSSSH